MATTKTTTPPGGEATFEHVALATIKTHPDNVRHDVGDVTDLAASIKEKGLLEPLVLVPRHDGISDRAMGKATWLLLAGHRRLAALKVAKVKTAPAVIRADLTTRSSQIEAMVVENQHRADLTPVEEGEALQLLLDIDPKTTQGALAERTGLPKKRVSERLRLAKLGDDARAKVHTGQVTLDDALAVAAFADDETTAAALEQSLGTASFHYRLEEARRAKKFATVFRQWCLDLRSSKCPAKEITDLVADYDGAEGLTVLPAVARQVGYVGYLAKDEQWKRWHAAHQDCEHHAFTIDDEHRDIFFWCLDPSVHGKHDQLEESDEQRARREAREAEDLDRRELVAKRFVAATVRGTFVREHVLPQASFELLRRVPPLVAENYTYSPQIARQDVWVALAAAFGLDVDTPGPQRMHALEGAFADLPAHALPGAWWFLSRVEDEVGLASWRAPQDQTGTVGADYVSELTSLGYPWSDFERDDLRIDEHGQRTAAPTEDDVDDEQPA